MGNGSETFKKKKKHFTVIQMESCSIHLVQMERGRMLNNYIYKATFFSHQFVSFASFCFLFCFVS